MAASPLFSGSARLSSTTESLTNTRTPSVPCSAVSINTLLYALYLLPSFGSISCPLCAAIFFCYLSLRFFCAWGLFHLVGMAPEITLKLYTDHHYSVRAVTTR